MIVVIQCAGTKRSGAGHLVAPDGRRVAFVADPQAAPVDEGVVYARPDDLADGQSSWRDVLLRCNEQPGTIPLVSIPPGGSIKTRSTRGSSSASRAERLHPVGWGLIGGGFLTPHYDITFSQSADAYKRRRKSDLYQDFRRPPERTVEPIVFFGGKDYLKLFCALTSSITATKTIFYNAAKTPHAAGCVLRRFDTTTKTNWHYECAEALLDGEIEPVD